MICFSVFSFFASAIVDKEEDFVRNPHFFQSRPAALWGRVIIVEPENYESIRLTRFSENFFQPVIEFSEFVLSKTDQPLRELSNLFHVSPKKLQKFSVEMLLHGINRGDLLSIQALVKYINNTRQSGIIVYPETILPFLQALERKLLAERSCINVDEFSIQSEQVAVTFSQFSKVGLRYLNDIYNGVRPSEKDIQDLYRRLPFLVQCAIVGGKKSFNVHLKRFGIHPLPSHRVTPELKVKMQELRYKQKYTLEGISNVTGFSISTVRRYTKPFEEKSWYEVFCGEDDSTADEEEDNVAATSSRDAESETQRFLGDNNKKDQ